ncbi:Voltage-dependent T-type calcium channel subunit alpha-1H [Symbiodinium microadriaticum]|uniref:Voltage-dependent T-type calcium channel subunit alpha-1H n=1 Tax=Symbiodinium microadriaticum TaxID=2951 RepID=A0A1Q9EPF0_SYMMI|nr:Voltage-dependent T-type calcium channel subunit alpha-1H [Symbiodinium microadriaticum]
MADATSSLASGVDCLAQEDMADRVSSNPQSDASIESLPLANAARPGHLWSAADDLPAAPDPCDCEDSDICMTTVHLLLQDLRREVLQELKGQNEVMQQILSRLGPSLPNFARMRPAPLKMGLDAEIAKKKMASQPAVNPTSSTNNGSWERMTSALEGKTSPGETSDGQVVSDGHEMAKAKSVKSDAEAVTSSKNLKSAKSARPSTKSQWSNFVPQGLFSTFSHYDLALQSAADTQEGAHSRMVFNHMSLRDVGDDAHKESCVQRMVRSSAFDLLCAMAVMTNSIFIGIEVQLSLSADDDVATSIHVIQYVYAAWFFLELAMRIWADGCSIFCGPDWMWSLLDLLVVSISLWEVVADIIYAVDSNDVSGNADGVTGLKALRVVRVTRILKVVRLMRVFRFVLAFRTLITSIAFTLKSLFWALMLLLLIVYVFAVLFCQAASWLAVRYFGSVSDTMISLFMSIAAGVSWENVIAPLRLISGMWALVFILYVSFTYFAVLNVVTGVFCQSAIESAQNDHATMVQSILKNKEAHIAKIHGLFSQLGTENTGVITFANFTEKINTPQVRAYFELLGLDVWAWSFFKLLDLDDSGDVAVEELWTRTACVPESVRAE